MIKKSITFLFVWGFMLSIFYAVLAIVNAPPTSLTLEIFLSPLQSTSILVVLSIVSVILGIGGYIDIFVLPKLREEYEQENN